MIWCNKYCKVIMIIIKLNLKKKTRKTKKKIFRGKGEVIYTMSSLFLRISSFHFTDKLLEAKYVLWFYRACSCLGVRFAVADPLRL